MRDLFKDYKIYDVNPAKLRSKDFYVNMLEYRKKVTKQFQHAIKKPKDFICPLCGKKKGNEFLSSGNYQLFECSNCKLVSPNIDPNFLGDENVYDDKAYIKDTTREIVDTYEYRKKTFAPERLDFILSQIKDIKKGKIKLLDVGCGPGYFIDYLKDQGIKYKGLELANFLVDICKKRGLNVEKAVFQNESNESYNIITLFDVLEHLSDPISVFKDLNKKLMPGGYVLAYTPNIHSLAYHLMGDKQNTLLPFQHFCFFDVDSLNYLAEKTGFKIHSVYYAGFDIMDYFFKKNFEDKYDYHKKLADFISIMQAIIDKQQLSNHIRVIFKKAD